MKKANWCVVLTLCGLSTSTLALGAPTITTVHTFNGGGDGSYPESGLTLWNGSLYGTTQQGGSWGYGTIYEIDAQTGDETVRYSFQGGSDGRNPAFTGLTIINGIIYGTASGGASGSGVIFSFDLASSTEIVLHSFDKRREGLEPTSGVFYKDGELYGTTFEGGNGKCKYIVGCGVAYKFKLSSGKLTVLHEFQGGDDGIHPEGFIMANKLLFGLTSNGSGSGCAVCGTIFTIDPSSGDYSVVYGFQPSTGTGVSLNKVGKYLYGTTIGNGSAGDGTIFRYDPSTHGLTTLLALGTGGLDGNYPEGGLLLERGLLYGVTALGGANGGGTIYTFNPHSQKATQIGSLGGGLGAVPVAGLTYDGASFWGTTETPGTVYKLTRGH